METQKIVLTGPCCSGKTTVLDLLEGKGYQIVPEAAREIIEENQNNPNFTLSTKEGLLDFQYQVLNRQLIYESQIPQGKTAFLDRSAIDPIGYLMNANMRVPDDIFNMVKPYSPHGEHPYSKVFFLELLPQEYFVNDMARKESYEQAQGLQSKLLMAHHEMGVNPIIVPGSLNPQQRLDMILQKSFDNF